MRLRSARTLVFSRESGGLLGLNYLTGSEFTCSPDLLTLLAMLDDWTEFDHVVESLPAMSRDELQSSIEALISVTAITEESSRQAEREEGYRANWTWGIPAALFHFSVEDREYISLEQAEEMQRSKLAEVGQPPLYLINNDSGTSVVKLPQSLNGSDLLKLMAKRRTVRSAAPRSISLRQLSDCLFAGLGITGEAVNCVGSLPLSMTPSGGARNPYEAYVYARSVEGLEPGFYHYSAFEHSLAKLEGEGAPKPSELMGGQDWADEMPCIIILCAFLERTMWKYSDPNAYRVVLIEAGHIGQNLMLAATHHGLSACPSAALSHSEIRKRLALGDMPTRTPVYALTLSAPAAEAHSVSSTRQGAEASNPLSQERRSDRKVAA